MSDDDKRPEDPGAFPRFNRIRDEIVHEDYLCAHRLNWFLASQAFLLSGLAIAHVGGSNPPTWTNNFFYPVLPLLGLSSAGLIFLSVVGGLVALAKWRQVLREEFKDSARYPRLEQDRWILLLGWTTPIALPLLFGITWIYFLIAGLFINKG